MTRSWRLCELRNLCAQLRATGPAAPEFGQALDDLLAAMPFRWELNGDASLEARDIRNVARALAAARLLRDGNALYTTALELLCGAIGCEEGR